jgi:hypothetical protein
VLDHLSLETPNDIKSAKAYLAAHTRSTRSATNPERLSQWECATAPYPRWSATGELSRYVGLTVPEVASALPEALSARTS